MDMRFGRVYFIWCYQVRSEADDEPQGCSEAEWHQTQGQGEDCDEGAENSPQLLVRLLPVTVIAIHIMWYTPPCTLYPVPCTLNPVVIALIFNFLFILF